MKKKQYQHTRWQRLTAGATLFLFIVTQNFSSGFTSITYASEAAGAALKVPPVFDQIKIPALMGRITEVFEGSSNQTVIVVQDAHAIPAAQKSIHHLIRYFESSYGLSTVALEGASKQLDPQIFRSFPDQKRLKEVMKDYLMRGELSGGTAAAIFSDNPKTIFRGVEDWRVYEEGIELYQSATAEKDKIIKKLEVGSLKLEEKKTQVYSKQLLETDRVLNGFNHGRGDLSVTLKKLAEVKRPDKDTELEALLQEIERETADPSTVEAEVRSIAEKIQKPEVGNLRLEEAKSLSQKYQELQTGQISAPAFALFLMEFLESKPVLYSKLSGDDPRLPAKLTRIARNQKTLRDIEGTNFFKAFEVYAQAVKVSLMTTEEQRALDRGSHELDLWMKMAKLELTRDEWEEVKSWKLDSESWKEKENKGNGLGLIVSNLDVIQADSGDERSGLPDRTSLLQTPNFQLRTFFKSHFAFYENAEARDSAFLKNISRLQPYGSQLSLLVAGGFHAKGVTQALKERGISYMLVIPAIETIPNETNYQGHMRGDVSWKKYFEVENGSVSLYKAFVRAVRDSLLELEVGSSKLEEKAVSGNNSKILKYWRDQIIRDLADQGRIEKAGNYTRFIDEVRRPSLSNGRSTVQSTAEGEVRRPGLSNGRTTVQSTAEVEGSGDKKKSGVSPDVLKKVERFIAGLKDLHKRNAVTSKNILGILKPATAIPPVESPLLLSAEVVPAALLGLGVQRSEVRGRVSPDKILLQRPIPVAGENDPLPDETRSYIDRHQTQWRWISEHFMELILDRAESRAKAAGGQPEIRIIDFGSASGEETVRLFYEVSQSLEQSRRESKHWKIVIDGVDYNDQMIQMATRGLSGRRAFFGAARTNSDYANEVINYANQNLLKLRQSLSFRKGDILHAEDLKASHPHADIVVVNHLLRIDEKKAAAIVDQLEKTWPEALLALGDRPSVLELADLSRLDYVTELLPAVDPANINETRYAYVLPDDLAEAFISRSEVRMMKPDRIFLEQDDERDFELEAGENVRNYLRLTVEASFGHQRGHERDERQSLGSVLARSIDVPENFKTPIKVLDVGTGKGDFPGLFKPELEALGYQAEIIGVDRDSKPDAQTNLGQNYKVFDFSDETEVRENLADQSFDLITMNAPDILSSARDVGDVRILRQGNFPAQLYQAEKLLSENGAIFIRLFEPKDYDRAVDYGAWLRAEGAVLRQILDDFPDLEFLEMNRVSSPVFAQGVTPLGPLIVLKRKKARRSEVRMTKKRQPSVALAGTLSPTEKTIIRGSLKNGLQRLGAVKDDQARLWLFGEQEVLMPFIAGQTEGLARDIPQVPKELYQNKKTLVLPGYGNLPFFLRLFGAESVLAVDADPATIAWQKLKAKAGQQRMADALLSVYENSRPMIRQQYQDQWIHYLDEPPAEDGFSQLEFRIGNILDTPSLSAEKFDLIIVPYLFGFPNGLLTEKDWDLALNNLKAVLNGGGRIIFFPGKVNVDKLKGQDFKEPKATAKRFGKWLEQLDSEGFEVTHSAPYDFYHFIGSDAAKASFSTLTLLPEDEAKKRRSEVRSEQPVSLAHRFQPLDDREASGLAEKIWLEFNRPGMTPELDLPKSFEGILTRGSSESSMVVPGEKDAEVVVRQVGPLVFVIADRMTEVLSKILKEKLAHHLDRYPGNIFLTEKAVYLQHHTDLGYFTTHLISVMLKNAKLFENAVVGDLGAGHGILAQVALALGAKHVMLADYSESDLNLARTFLYAQGALEDSTADVRPGTFSMYPSDFMIPEGANVIAELAGRADILLVNIGPWTEYLDVNETVLKIAAAQPHWKFLLNSGYRVEKNEKGHKDELNHSFELFSEPPFSPRIFREAGRSELSRILWVQRLNPETVTKPAALAVRSEVRGALKLEELPLPLAMASEEEKERLMRAAAQLVEKIDALENRPAKILTIPGSGKWAGQILQAAWQVMHPDERLEFYDMGDENWETLRAEIVSSKGPLLVLDDAGKTLKAINQIRPKLESQFESSRLTYAVLYAGKFPADPEAFYADSGYSQESLADYRAAFPFLQGRFIYGAQVDESVLDQGLPVWHLIRKLGKTGSANKTLESVLGQMNYLKLFRAVDAARRGALEETSGGEFQQKQQAAAAAGEKASEEFLRTWFPRLIEELTLELQPRMSARPLKVADIPVFDDEASFRFSQAQASKILHDFRNVVAPLYTYAHRLLDGSALPQDSPNRKILQSLMEMTEPSKLLREKRQSAEVEEVAQMLETYREFASEPNNLTVFRAAFEELDEPASYIDGVETMLKATFKKILEFSGDDPLTVIRLSDILDEAALSDVSAVELVKDYQTPVNTEIRVRPLKFSRVILNLIRNAKEAMQDKGSPGKVYLRTKLSKDGQTIGVIVEVEDEGVGIPEEKLSVIWNPDYTTKESGTGLGLASVKEIVEQDLKGTIQVRSVLGQGTLFAIQIPPELVSFQKEAVPLSIFSSAEADMPEPTESHEFFARAQTFYNAIVKELSDENIIQEGELVKGVDKGLWHNAKGALKNMRRALQDQNEREFLSQMDLFLFLTEHYERSAEWAVDAKTLEEFEGGALTRSEVRSGEDENKTFFAKLLTVPPVLERPGMGRVLSVEEVMSIYPSQPDLTLLNRQIIKVAAAAFGFPEPNVTWPMESSEPNSHRFIFINDDGVVTGYARLVINGLKTELMELATFKDADHVAGRGQVLMNVVLQTVRKAGLQKIRFKPSENSKPFYADYFNQRDIPVRQPAPVKEFLTYEANFRKASDEALNRVYLRDTLQSTAGQSPAKSEVRRPDQQDGRLAGQSSAKSEVRASGGDISTILQGLIYFRQVLRDLDWIEKEFAGADLLPIGELKNRIKSLVPYGNGLSRWSLPIPQGMTEDTVLEMMAETQRLLDVFYRQQPLVTMQLPQGVLVEQQSFPWAGSRFDSETPDHTYQVLINGQPYFFGRGQYVRFKFEDGSRATLYDHHNLLYGFLADYLKEKPQGQESRRLYVHYDAHEDDYSLPDSVRDKTRLNRNQYHQEFLHLENPYAIAQLYGNWEFLPAVQQDLLPVNQWDWQWVGHGLLPSDLFPNPQELNQFQVPEEGGIGDVDLDLVVYGGGRYFSIDEGWNRYLSESRSLLLEQLPNYDFLTFFISDDRYIDPILALRIFADLFPVIAAEKIERHKNKLSVHQKKVWGEATARKNDFNPRRSEVRSQDQFIKREPEHVVTTVAELKKLQGLLGENWDIRVRVKKPGRLAYEGELTALDDSGVITERLGLWEVNLLIEEPRFDEIHLSNHFLLLDPNRLTQKETPDGSVLKVLDAEPVHRMTDDELIGIAAEKLRALPLSQEVILAALTSLVQDADAEDTLVLEGNIAPVFSVINPLWWRHYPKSQPEDMSAWLRGLMAVLKEKRSKDEDARGAKSEVRVLGLTPESPLDETAMDVRKDPRETVRSKPFSVSEKEAERFANDLTELYYLLSAAQGGNDSLVTLPLIHATLTQLKQGLRDENPKILLNPEDLRLSDAQRGHVVEHSEEILEWMNYMRQTHTDLLMALEVLQEPDYSDLVFTPGRGDAVLILGPSMSGKSSLATALQNKDYLLGGESDTGYLVLKIPGYFLMAGAGSRLETIRARAWSNEPELDKRRVPVQHFGARIGLVKAIIQLRHPASHKPSGANRKARQPQISFRWTQGLQAFPEMQDYGQTVGTVLNIKVTHGYVSADGFRRLSHQLDAILERELDYNSADRKSTPESRSEVRVIGGRKDFSEKLLQVGPLSDYPGLGRVLDVEKVIAQYPDEADRRELSFQMLRLAATVFGFPAPKTSSPMSSEPNSKRLVFIDETGTITGSAHMAMDGSRAELMRLATLKSEDQIQGRGQVLLNEVLQSLRREGIQKLTMMVTESSLPFYKEYFVARGIPFIQVKPFRTTLPHYRADLTNIPDEKLTQIDLSSTPANRYRSEVRSLSDETHQSLEKKAEEFIVRILPQLSESDKKELARDLAKRTTLTGLNEDPHFVFKWLPPFLAGIFILGEMTFAGLLGAFFSFVMRSLGLNVAAPSQFFIWTIGLAAAFVGYALAAFYKPKAVLSAYSDRDGIYLLLEGDLQEQVLKGDPRVAGYLFHEWARQLKLEGRIQEDRIASSVQLLHRYELEGKAVREFIGQIAHDKEPSGFRGFARFFWWGNSRKHTAREFKIGYDAMQKAVLNPDQKALARVDKLDRFHLRDLSGYHGIQALLSLGQSWENYGRSVRLGGMASAMLDDENTGSEEAWAFLRYLSLNKEENAVSALLRSESIAKKAQSEVRQPDQQDGRAPVQSSAEGEVRRPDQQDGRAPAQSSAEGEVRRPDQQDAALQRGEVDLNKSPHEKRSEVRSLEQGRQTGMAESPRDAFTNYYRALRTLMPREPKQEWTVISAAAGPSVRDLYLSTGFTKAYFLDEIPISMEKLNAAKAELLTSELPQKHAAIERYRQRRDSKGYADAHLFGDDLEYGLLKELEDLGVLAESLEFSVDEKISTRTRIRFELEGVRREVEWVPADLLNLSDSLQKELQNKADVYYQKASQNLPSFYQQYLYQVVQWVKPGGLLLLNDVTSGTEIIHSGDYLSPVDFEPARNPILNQSEKAVEQALGITEDSRPKFFYGWQMTPWRKKDNAAQKRSEIRAEVWHHRPAEWIDEARVGVGLRKVREEMNLIKSELVDMDWSQDDLEDWMPDLSFREKVIRQYLQAVRYFNRNVLNAPEMNSEKFKAYFLKLHGKIGRSNLINAAGKVIDPTDDSEIDQIFEEMFSEQFDERLKLNPLRAAAVIFVRLVNIQGFYDGNKRTASFVLNYILLKAGYEPFILTGDNAAEYFHIVMPIRESGKINRAEFQDFLERNVSRRSEVRNETLSEGFKTGSTEILYPDMSEEEIAEWFKTKIGSVGVTVDRGILTPQDFDRDEFNAENNPWKLEYGNRERWVNEELSPVLGAIMEELSLDEKNAALRVMVRHNLEKGPLPKVWAEMPVVPRVLFPLKTSPKLPSQMQGTHSEITFNLMPGKEDGLYYPVMIKTGNSTDLEQEAIMDALYDRANLKEFVGVVNLSGNVRGIVYRIIPAKKEVASWDVLQMEFSSSLLALKGPPSLLKTKAGTVPYDLAELFKATRMPMVSIINRYNEIYEQEKSGSGRSEVRMAEMTPDPAKTWDELHLKATAIYMTLRDSQLVAQMNANRPVLGDRDTDVFIGIIQRVGRLNEFGEVVWAMPEMLSSMVLAGMSAAEILEKLEPVLTEYASMDPFAEAIFSEINETGAVSSATADDLASLIPVSLENVIQGLETLEAQVRANQQAAGYQNTGYVQSSIVLISKILEIVRQLKANYPEGAAIGLAMTERLDNFENRQIADQHAHALAGLAGMIERMIVIGRLPEEFQTLLEQQGFSGAKLTLEGNPRSVSAPDGQSRVPVVEVGASLEGAVVSPEVLRVLLGSAGYDSDRDNYSFYTLSTAVALQYAFSVMAALQLKKGMDPSEISGELLRELDYRALNLFDLSQGKVSIMINAVQTLIHEFQARSEIRQSA